MSLGALLKIAKGGGLGPAEISTLFEAMGMDVDMRELEKGEYREAFTRAGTAASLPGAKLVTIRGRDKSGAQLEVLLVMAPDGKRLPDA